MFVKDIFVEDRSERSHLLTEQLESLDLVVANCLETVGLMIAHYSESVEFVIARHLETLNW